MKINLPLLLLNTIVLFTACSKDENSVPSADTSYALIKTVSIDSALLTEYEYNSQGLIILQKAYEAGNIDSTTFTYSTSSMTRKLYRNGQLIETEENILSNGNVIHTDGMKTDSSYRWRVNYTYDANGYRISESHLDSDSVEDHRFDYTVSDGNFVSRIQNYTEPITTFYDFFPGTINSINIPHTGITYMGKRSKNLIKKETTQFSGSLIIFDYSYIFDSKGRVSKMTMKGDNLYYSLNFTYY